MEQINLYNYEAFFLDYLEGNLDKAGRIQLEIFLAEHPALEEELKEMGGLDELVLVPEEKTLGDTSFLKGGAQLNRITEEDWMIQSIEGELTNEQQVALDHHIKEHQLEKTFKAYQLTKLKANPFIVLNDKSALKRKEAAAIPMWMRYSAAASVLILLGVVGFSLFQNDSSNPLPVENYTAQTQNEVRPRLIITDKVFGEEQETIYDYNYTPENQLADNQKEDPFTEKSDSLPAQTPPILPELNDDPIAHLPETPVDTIKKNIPVQLHDLDNDDIAVAVEQESDIVTEEPFKIITNATGNLLNREVQYTRDRKVQNNEYVAHHFKLGKFEFERKKKK